MPRLPTAADFGTRPIPAGGGRPPVALNTASAEAVQRAGGQVMSLGEEMLQQEAVERERALTLRAEEGYNELIEKSFEFADGEDGFRRKEGAEAANKPIAEDYWGRYEQAAREIEGRLPTGAAEKFRHRAKAYGIQYRQDLRQHLARQRDVYGKQVYDNAKGVEVRSAGLHWDDPLAVAASVERLNAVINGRAQDEQWDDDTLTLERANALSGLHTSVVVSALDSDDLKYADSYFKKISPEVDDDTRHKLSRAIDGKRKEQEAEARQQQVLYRLELQETVGDVQAAYLSGVKYEGDIPTRAEFVAAYGDDGAKRYESFQKVLAVGEDIQAAALANPQEQAALLAKNQPSPTAGFKDAQERQQILATSIARINKEREDDPARFAIQRIPGVGAAYRAMVTAKPEDAQAFAEEYVAQVQAAAADLGIQSPKVLPDEFAGQIVAGFYDQKEGGEPAAERIIAERQRWGRAWPAVWSQISKDLPGAAYVIGAGMSVEAGRRLAEVSMVDRPQLDKWLATQNVKPGDVKTAVASSLNNAALSLAGQPGADKLFATLADSAERLATRYVGMGKGVNDAAEQAANEVFNERYSFFDHNEATIRVPKPYDGREVKSALKVVTRDLSGVPRVDESHWVTLPNDAGVALTWMGGVVRRPDGSPVVYGWDDLLNRAATVGFRQGLPPDPARRVR